MQKNITSNMTEYRKDYRHKNPEKFTTKVKCDVCSGKYQLCSKNQHFKTQLHIVGSIVKQYEADIEILKEKNKRLKDDLIELKDKLKKKLKST